MEFNKNRDRTYFEKKGLDQDVINLRFKHYQSRLIDTLNRVLEERRRISKLEHFYYIEAEKLREEIRQNANNAQAVISQVNSYLPRRDLM